jgi:hypothetical protein
MTELHASRTLVKSPPELWAECSDAASLARHLGQFGQIRITRLDPETAVAWEGERTRGTVRIEPAGWGTKVILTAVAVSEQPPVALEEPRAAPEEPSEPPNEFVRASEGQPEPVQATEPRRRRRFSWLFARRRARELPPESEPDSVESPPEPEAAEPEPQPAVSDTEAALAAALESLGQAHHRPYSRA